MAIPITITGPTIEPVTLQEVKDYLGITDEDNSQNLTILGKIIAAREYVEKELRQSLMTQTLEIALQSFGDVINLPSYPVQSVSSVTYTDETGADVVLATSVYGLNQYSHQPYIHLKYDQEWPTFRDQVNPIRIQYIAGYPDRDSVPFNIKQALFIILGNWIRYQANNESGLPISTIPWAAEQMLKQIRIPNI